MRTLVVEGWRFLPHSYALVNQYQLLELAGRGDVELYHRDAEIGLPHWRQVEGVMSREQEARLREIPAPPAGLRPDVLLRVSSPMRLEPGDAERTFVFGTCEVGVVVPLAVAGGQPRKSLRELRVEIVTPSRWSAEGMIRTGADPRRVHIVPHGVDVSLHRPLDAAEREAVRAGLGWGSSFVFLHLGAMFGNKGIDVLLRAFARVAQRSPSAILVLKGTDALYASSGMVQSAMSVLTPAEASVVRARTRYMGDTLDSERLARLFQAADVYVAPYRGEGFNLPVLEAAACGLGVICTKGGPTDDFTTPEFAMRISSRIKPMTGGMMAPEPDLAHLTALMTDAASNAAFRERARRAGPAFVRERFTWKHAVDKLLGVLFG